MGSGVKTSDAARAGSALEGGVLLLVLAVLVLPGRGPLRAPHLELDALVVVVLVVLDPVQGQTALQLVEGGAVGSAALAVRLQDLLQAAHAPRELAEHVEPDARLARL